MGVLHATLRKTIAARSGASATPTASTATFLDAQRALATVIRAHARVAGRAPASRRAGILQPPRPAEIRKTTTPDAHASKEAEQAVRLSCSRAWPPTMSSTSPAHR